MFLDLFELGATNMKSQTPKCHLSGKDEASIQCGGALPSNPQKPIAKNTHFSFSRFYLDSSNAFSAILHYTFTFFHSGV